MAGKVNWRESAPEGGWKDRTYYVVTVTFNPSNTPHRSILYTGFLERDGSPGNYSGVFNPSYEPKCLMVDLLYSVKVVSEIPDIGKGQP